MSTALFNLLTDATKRDEAAVETALSQETSAGWPWA